MLVVTLARMGWKRAKKKVRNLVAACAPIMSLDSEAKSDTYDNPKPFGHFTQISGGLDPRARLRHYQPALEVVYDINP